MMIRSRRRAAGTVAVVGGAAVAGALALLADRYGVFSAVVVLWLGSFVSVLAVFGLDHARQPAPIAAAPRVEDAPEPAATIDLVAATEHADQGTDVGHGMLQHRRRHHPTRESLRTSS